MNDCRCWERSKNAKVLVKGIPRMGVPGLFSDLNSTIVDILPKGKKVLKRKVDLVTRSFMRDKNQGYVYDNYTVPSGSVVVATKFNLHLRWNTKYSDGFSFIDFEDTREGRYMYYIIPKKYLYRVNQTALVVSVKNMKSYSGMGYRSYRNGVVFLHIIPYTPSREYIGSRVLKTKMGLDYSKEIEAIVGFWESVGFIPRVGYCFLEDGNNLVLKKTNSDLVSYKAVEMLSLEEEGLYNKNTEVDMLYLEESNEG